MSIGLWVGLITADALGTDYPLSTMATFWGVPSNTPVGLVLPCLLNCDFLI
jgi:hypothetical protein